VNPVAAPVGERAGSSRAEAKKDGRAKKGDLAKNGSELGLRPDWAKLPGHTVEVWLLGEYVARGVVEQAAEDDSVLWLAGAGADTRRLFDKGTGYQVWV
jgi:hypothetical protein